MFDHIRTLMVGTFRVHLPSKWHLALRQGLRANSRRPNSKPNSQGQLRI
jgi:hypothetical protein